MLRENLEKASRSADIILYDGGSYWGMGRLEWVTDDVIKNLSDQNLAYGVYRYMPRCGRLVLIQSSYGWSHFLNKRLEVNRENTLYFINLAEIIVLERFHRLQRDFLFL
jgi:hypothetical protein